MMFSITITTLLVQSIIVLLCYLQLALASATFYVGNQTFTYPTQDLMDIYIALYTFTGYVAKAIFDESQEYVISPKTLENIQKMMVNTPRMLASKPLNVTIVVYSDEIDDTLCDTITAVSIDDDDDGFEY